MGGVLLALAGAILALLLVRWAAGSVAGDAAGVTGITGIYFWIFSAIALIGAVRVITHRQPVYSALYFVLTVFATAGLFLLLQAEFIAASLVLIYAGAILVTYVFVIMLAAQAAPSPKGALAVLAEHDTVSREPFAATLAGFVLMGVMLFVIFDKYRAIAPAGPMGGTTMDAVSAAQAAQVAEAAKGSEVTDSVFPGAFDGSTQQLGFFLFNSQVVSVELGGLILTIAMVGAIIIARRRIVQEGSSGAAVNADISGELVLGPATPIDDNPYSIPVYGTRNPRQKAYPET
jgi:NADH-quinone oxidoreductase subunit J